VGSDRDRKEGCFSYLLRFLGIKKKGIDFSVYGLRKSLLTRNEREFYKVLKIVVGDRFEVFSKVRLSDVFWVERGEGYRGALNRINPRHVDFLLCEKETMKPILGIELDDVSHLREDRVERDEFVDGLYERVGLPLLRVKTKKEYFAEDLRELIVREFRRRLRA